MIPPRWTCVQIPSAFVALFGMLVSVAGATTYDWIGGNSTAWATGANWSPSGPPLSSLTADIAQFNQTSYSFQPTATASRQINGIISGDGTVNTAALTITTSTGASRLGIGSSGILLNANSGNVTIGTASTQGVSLGASQSWLNNSSSLLTVTSAANLSGSASPVTLTLGGNGTGGITITNVIADSGTVGGVTSVIVNKTGGAVTLGGTNTFTGGVTLTSGTLNINAAAALGNAAGAFTINGGTIDQTVASVTLTARPMTLGGNFTYGGTSNLNMGAGAITNAGDRTITLLGTGKTLTMGGVMTNTKGAAQTTTVNGVGNTFSLGNYALSDSATNYLNVINGSGNVIISSVISDGGTSTASGLIYSGTGSLTLTGVNSYRGGLTLNSGTLNINSTRALGASAAGVFTINGGTIDTTNAIGTMSGNASSIVFGGNFTFGGTSNLHLGNSPISNTGDRSIQLNGTAKTLTIGGVMTNTKGSAQITTVTGAGNTLLFSGYALSDSAANYVNVFAGDANITISGSVTNGGTSTASGLTYRGTGLLTLGGTGTFSGGLNVESGTVRLSNTTAAGTGLITLGSVGTSAVLDLNGASRTINSLATAGTAADQTITNSSATSGIVNYTGNTTSVFGGVIENGSGGGTTALTLNNAAASLTLSGANTYSGTTLLSAGTLVLNHANNGGLGSGNLSMVNGTLQALTVGRSIANVVTLDGATNIVSGSQNLTLTNSLTVQGAATRTLTSNVTAGGILTVANLFLSDSQTTGRVLTINGTGNTAISNLADSSAGVSSNASASGLTVNQPVSGILSLANANTYTGTTTITAGSVSVGNKSSFGLSNLVLNGAGVSSISATTDLSGPNAITNNFTVTSSGGNFGFTGTNNLEFAANSTTNVSHTFTNNIVGGSLILSGTQNLSSSTSNFTRTFSGNGSTVVSGAITNGTAGSAASVISYNGTGTLTLTNTNTYGGATIISNGSVRIGDNGTTGTLGGGNATLTTPGQLVFNRSDAITVANNITGTGSVTHLGGSSLRLSGNNTFTGGLTIATAGGSVIAGFNSSFGGIGNGTVTMANDTVLDVNGTTFSTGLLKTSGTGVGASVTSNNSTASVLTISGTGTETYAGTISNGASASLSLTKSGTGTQAVSGVLSHTGNTTITNGTLQAIANAGNTDPGTGVTSALSQASVLSLSSSSALIVPRLDLRADVDTTFSPGGLQLLMSASQARNYEINVGAATTGVGRTITLDTAYTIGTIGLGSELRIRGDSGYTLVMGDLPSSQGEWIIDVQGAALRLGNFEVANSTSFVRVFTGSGNTTITGNLTRSTTSRSLTLTQSGTGSLTLLGAATTSAAANQAGYFFNLSDGQLNINNAQALGSNATGAYFRELNISGGVLDNTSGAAITTVSNPEVNVNGDFTFAATDALSLGAGAVGLGDVSGATRTITVEGTTNALTLGSVTDGAVGDALIKDGTGTLVLSSSSFYTGGTTINNGTLVVNGGLVSAISANGTTGATTGTDQRIAGLTVNTSNLRVGQTVAGVGIAAGSFIVTIDSSSQINLSKNATSLNATTTLTFGEGSATGTGAVSVGTSGTLAGNGTVSGLVSTTNTGSVISAGDNSAATLTLAGGLDISSGATFNFDLGASSGGTSDLITTGNLIGAGTGQMVFNFFNSGAGITTGVAYTLINYTSQAGLNRSDIFVNSLPTDYLIDTSYGDDGFLIGANSIQVQFTVVPEPVYYGFALGIGLLVVGFLRRRRMKESASF